MTEIQKFFNLLYSEKSSIYNIKKFFFLSHLKNETMLHNEFYGKGGKDSGMDFYKIRVRKLKNGTVEIYPDFMVDDEARDLMIRGKDFYAVFDEKTNMWNQNALFIQKLVDRDLWTKYDEIKHDPRYEGSDFDIKTVKSGDSGSWLKFVKLVRNLPDCYHQLDEKLTFQDTVVQREDYVSKRLPYSVRDGDISAYEEMMSTLYEPEERQKFEWAIGSIIAGESKRIQKFIVFYGPMGSGKSTVMNLIEKLFGGYGKKGYCAKLNAKALVGNNVGFALEPFSKNPLVGIDQDSKLSRIEDNTILNQIISHDTLQINEKFKNLYEASAGCFIFMGTNEPVKITDSKSGIIRRLIDVEPTGNLILPEERYDALVEKMNYELGAIAKHCLDVYRKLGRTYYSRYRPTRMMVRTDPFFNFMKDNLETFEMQEGVTAQELWTMYKLWCNDSGMEYMLKRFQAMDEAKNYFENYEERTRIDGKQVRNWYSGLKMSKFIEQDEQGRKEVKGSVKPDIPKWLELTEMPSSTMEELFADCPAQYPMEDGSGRLERTWKNCKTKLRDINPRKTHHLRVPGNLVTFDFDKTDANGNKDTEANIRAAAESGLPETYAELSKGGGLHVEYFYDGDINGLSRIFAEGVEIKVFPEDGLGSLRRRLSKCNNLPIAHISSGLPLKTKKVINEFALQDAKHLRTRVLKALRKEIEPRFTTTCVNYIEAQLEEAQEKGIAYDLQDLDHAIYSFAASSSNNADGCLKKYAAMKLRWPEKEEAYTAKVADEQKAFIPDWNRDAPLVFCDVEVGRNVLIVCYKEAGEDKQCIRMINPKPYELETLFNMRLAGFNCLSYDGPILYARYNGYTNEQLYELSQDIIVNDRRSPFREARNVFYLDVFDYTTKKQSLKKWEIELGEPHMEMNVDWTEPIPEAYWPQLAEYCCNDVKATEKVYLATQEDLKAREILADLTDMPVITTTNNLTAKYIFGDVWEPWKDFVYPDLKAKFPGYQFKGGKSYYNDVLIGEGGRVYAEPGMYYNVKTYDVASMHPSSIIAENGFGPYTKRFKDLMDIRLAIKHKDFDTAKKLDPRLAKYLNDPAEAKALGFALKIAINSVYGMTAARFQNRFKDPRNIDNWVAKRGALFMESLRLKVQEMGAKVVHIKTDSIKIVEPTKEVEDFILRYGKEWGYTFEVESIYERICLVNDAVYIAKCSNDPSNGDEAGHWTATGAQFQHPYVFKTLFSHEKLTFPDLCEARSVKTDIWLDMNEHLPDVSEAEKEKDKIDKKLKDTLGVGWENLLRDLISSKPEDIPDPTTAMLAKRREQLEFDIVKGHDYQFIGRVGEFCPIKPGKGGGLLMRRGTDGRYSSVGGTKGFRWLEAMDVKALRYEDNIDMRYFRELTDAAVDTIRKFGDFETFVQDDENVPFTYPYEQTIQN